MSCKGQEMPTLGILGMTAHKIGKLAQTMYAEYDLNKSQSMILFQLHRDGRISQKELAQKLNIIHVDHRAKTVVTYLDPEEL